MNFSDFERAEPANLPEFVSPLYFELIREIDARGGTDNARIIKFCIAYTTYCARKKDNILDLIGEGRSPSHSSVRKCFEAFQSDWVINDLIDAAKEVLADTLKELREASIDTIVVEVKNSITQAKNELAGDLTRQSNALGAKFDAADQPSRRAWWRGILDFIVAGIRHAGHLLVAVVFLTLVVAAIDLLWPALLQGIVHIVEDVISILRK